MIFKLFVQDLGDRVFHIAENESRWKGGYIAKIGKVRRITILSILCDNGKYLAGLVGTLETDRNTKVVAIKDGESKYIDLRKIYHTSNDPIIEWDKLCLTDEKIDIAV